MTANFDMIQKAYEGHRAKLETVKKILNRPMTYAEKVLYSHLWQKTDREFAGGKDYVELSPCFKAGRYAYVAYASCW